jgi:hypothetical protein
MQPFRLTSLVTQFERLLECVRQTPGQLPTSVTDEQKRDWSQGQAELFECEADRWIGVADVVKAYDQNR